MNEKEFCLWVENQKSLSGIDFDFHITPNGANQSNITPPTIYINKNMLNKPDEIKGVFLHELGHVAHPLDEKTKRGLALAKVLEFGQILAFPYLYKITHFLHINIGVSYITMFTIFLFLLKFTLNNYFQRVSEPIKKSEYLADAFSYLNDPEKQQLKYYETHQLKLSLFDIFTKISPVFILETHPTVYERIDALKNKTYFTEALKNPINTIT